MRKEVVIAIFFGILFGLFIAFGIYRANTAMEPETSPEQLTQEEDLNENTMTSSQALTIASPSNHDVITDTKVDITGITDPNTKVAVSSENEDYLIEPGENGEFSQLIDLEPGLNQIIISSMDPNNSVDRLVLSLVHTTQLENEDEVATDPEDSTESANPVREKVKEKIENVLSQNKAYLGSVNDILEDTIQISDVNDEIQLVSITDGTTYSDITDDPEDIEKEDVAIGDYIIAMGKIDETNVLNAKRILITQVPEEPSRGVYFTKIEDLQDRTISFSENNDTVEAVFPRRWKGPEIDELTEGDQIMLVTIPDDGDLTIRTILNLENTSED